MTGKFNTPFPRREPPWAHLPKIEIPLQIDAKPIQTEKITRPLPCKFRGAGTGEIELVACESCGGNVRIKYAIYKCEIFEKCLPKPHQRDQVRTEIKLCEGCMERQE